MTPFDWSLVVLLNGGAVAYALLGPRRSESSRDWFLGGRSLAWWIVGISAFATAIDRVIDDAVTRKRAVTEHV